MPAVRDGPPAAVPTFGQALAGLRQLVRRNDISFQRTRTWKESTDPDKDTKLDRIEVATRFPGPMLRLRPVRAAVDPPAPRLVLAAKDTPGPAAGHLPPHPRHPLLPRLLMPRRRPALGRHAPPQGRRPQPDRVQIDPGRPPGRRPDLNHLRQPLGQHHPGDPGLGRRNKVELCLPPTNASWANPIEAPAPQLSAGVDLSAYRIVQQALANTLEHAGSAHAAVDIRYTPDTVEIEVSDDGAGPSRRGGDGYGHGLVGMRERVALYGGELVTGARPGGGYALRARLSLSGEAP